MATSFDRTLVELDRTRFLRITAGTGTTVACLEGCLWVNRDWMRLTSGGSRR